MAKGKNAEQNGHLGKEYWKSRLHRWGEEMGRYTKHLTHKKERRYNKNIANNALKEVRDL